MKLVRSVTGSAIAAAMLATSVAPAMAQGYPGYGYNSRGYGYGNDRYRHRRHRDRIDAGDVIGAVAVVGIIAAIASAASKNSRDRRYGDQYRGNINSENEAAEACSIAVEQRAGRDTRVRGIDQVARTRDGYEVRGQLDTRGGYNDRGDSFTCSVRYGRVENVQIGDGYAYQGY